MFWLQFHLYTITPCLPLGAFLIFRPVKGDKVHKALGKLWSVLMLVSSASSFAIQSRGHFSWLHGLAVVSIVSVLKGLQEAKAGRIEDHQNYMIGPYIGSLVAFGFALRPTRYLGKLLNSYLEK